MSTDGSPAERDDDDDAWAWVYDGIAEAVRDRDQPRLLGIIAHLLVANTRSTQRIARQQMTRPEGWE